MRGESASDEAEKSAALVTKRFREACKRSDDLARHLFVEKGRRDQPSAEDATISAAQNSTTRFVLLCSRREEFYVATKRARVALGALYASSNVSMRIVCSGLQGDRADICSLPPWPWCVRGIGQVPRFRRA